MIDAYSIPYFVFECQGKSDIKWIKNRKKRVELYSFPFCGIIGKKEDCHERKNIDND